MNPPGVFQVLTTSDPAAVSDVFFEDLDLPGAAVDLGVDPADEERGDGTDPGEIPSYGLRLLQTEVEAFREGRARGFFDLRRRDPVWAATYLEIPAERLLFPIPQGERETNPNLSQIERGIRKPSAEILQSIAKALQISSETLYVRAGILDADRQPDLVSEILQDPNLTEAQKQSLIDTYRNYVQLSDQADPSPKATDR